MLSKKYYVQIAKILNDTRPTLVEETREMTMWKFIATRLSIMLQNDNPKFNIEKFCKAIYGETK